MLGLATPHPHGRESQGLQSLETPTLALPEDSGVLTPTAVATIPVNAGGGVAGICAALWPSPTYLLAEEAVEHSHQQTLEGKGGQGRPGLSAGRGRRGLTWKELRKRSKKSLAVRRVP